MLGLRAEPQPPAIIILNTVSVGLGRNLQDLAEMLGDHREAGGTDILPTEFKSPAALCGVRAAAPRWRVSLTKAAGRVPGKNAGSPAVLENARNIQTL